MNNSEPTKMLNRPRPIPVKRNKKFSLTLLRLKLESTSKMPKILPLVIIFKTTYPWKQVIEKLNTLIKPRVMKDEMTVKISRVPQVKLTYFAILTRL